MINDKQQISEGACASVASLFSSTSISQVCRVTISLVAIMLELTGGMTYIVPFMIAVP